jgi:plastocyanin
MQRYTVDLSKDLVRLVDSYAARSKILPHRIRQSSNKDGIPRRGFLQCMAWTGAAATAGVVSSAAASLAKVANTIEVKIDNFAFVPKSVTIKQGETVTWTNRDDIPHVIVSTEKKFSSPVLDTDQAFSFTFQEPGSYPYCCKIHPTMTGTVGHNFLFADDLGDSKAAFDTPQNECTPQRPQSSVKQRNASNVFIEDVLDTSMVTRQIT